jgi:hypothetical protein
VCTGSTTPSQGSKPLFYAECGANHVVTSNQYHFTTAATPTVIHYCIVDGAVPSFKLRGYIPNGNRDGFATSEYAPNFWRNLRGE